MGASALATFGAGMHEGYCRSRGIETSLIEEKISGTIAGLYATIFALCGGVIGVSINTPFDPSVKRDNKEAAKDAVKYGAKFAAIPLSIFAALHVMGACTGYLAGHITEQF